MMRKPLVVGNWKMHGTIEESLKLMTEIRHKLGNPSVEVVIAPPFTSLYTVHVAIQDTSLQLAAQDMHWDTEGAYTGEVSGVFLKDLECSYVILGHSEKRQQAGETDEKVNKKILAALTLELKPIFCIGETEAERKSGETEAVLEAQLKKGLHGVPMADLNDVVIAYEPVWAIGTGKTPSPKEIEDTHHFIRNKLGKDYDAPTAASLRLLYGGSVNEQNAKDLIKVKGVDGFLVGGASLKSDSFLKIIASCGSEEKEPSWKHS